MLLIKNEHHTLFRGGRDYHTNIFFSPISVFSQSVLPERNKAPNRIN